MRRVARQTSVGGVALVVIGLSIVHAGVIAVPRYALGGGVRLIWIASYILLISVATYSIGLPDQPSNKRQAAWLALLSATAGALGISLVQLIAGNALLPRFVVFGTVLLNMPLQIAANWASRYGSSRAAERDRILLVGSHAEQVRLTDDLLMEPERTASFVGFISPEEIAHAPSRSMLLVDKQRSSQASVIVLNHSAQLTERVVREAAALHESGIRIRTLQAFYEEWLGKLPINELERVGLFFDIGELHRTQYVRVRRVIDVTLAVWGLLILGLIIPVVFLLNIFGNRGPLFFKQTRVGKGGRTFLMLKFRTMAHTQPSSDDEADPTHGSWTRIEDTRVTPVGRILRRSHLDELPQMVNVMRGELSIVGPRPEQPFYVDTLNAKLPFYSLRHLVRPGLTGWAQVKYGYASNEDDALEKLQYEFFYLQNQDLRFDLTIMLRTMRSLIGGPGAGR